MDNSWHQTVFMNNTFNPNIVTNDTGHDTK